ncbi:hypothetical protein HAX54_032091, partial [Datura stramonium]|nr:hypothetical protein [Datura stramonium]
MGGLLGSGQRLSMFPETTSQGMTHGAIGRTILSGHDKRFRKYSKFISMTMDTNHNPWFQKTDRTDESWCE